MKFDTIRHRLRSDFQLAILTFLSLLAVLGIAPFAAWRALAHEWPAFLMDVFIIAVIGGGVHYAWRTGDAARTGLFLSYFVGVMAVLASHVLGIYGTYWIYPALIANFFLAPRKHALISALVVLSLITLTGGLHRETREAASFVATILVSVLLAYVFAYRTAEQREQLRRLASLDALTGIYNRRILLDELSRSQKILAREGKKQGLLLLDLDHFKEINDRYGHGQGDEVLIRFARLLENNLRPYDRVFRYGGEEFVVLAQVDDARSLHVIAEKLRSVVEKHLDDGHGHPVTTSIGGAMLHAGESSEEWIDRADAALYLAKQKGRNQVVIGAGTHNHREGQRVGEQSATTAETTYGFVSSSNW